ncbi:MAG: ATP synthase F0 subunit B [Parasporobacterium sp.]|nr:ATP synthase F0 subunit B [Parasporobacterium sp.]
MSGVPLNIDFQQILLHLLNFVILFAILYFLLFKPVKNFMDNRKKEYQDMDDKAHKKLKEAEELKADYEKKLSSADEEIRLMKAEASKELDEFTARSEADAREKAAQIIEKAKAQGESEKSRIINTAGIEISELAKEAAAKVVFGNASDAFDRFLDGQKDN